MPRFIPPFSYEDIPERGAAHRFRVSDDEDDMVTDFPTEEEAKEYCRKANSGEIKPSWHF